MDSLYLKEFKELYEKNRNKKKAIPMKKYMKNLFEFYGIPSPERKKKGKRGQALYEIVSNTKQEVRNPKQKILIFVPYRHLAPYGKKGQALCLSAFLSVLVKKS